MEAKTRGRIEMAAYIDAIHRMQDRDKIVIAKRRNDEELERARERVSELEAVSDGYLRALKD